MGSNTGLLAAVKARLAVRAPHLARGRGFRGVSRYTITPEGDQDYVIRCDGASVQRCPTQEEAIAWVRAKFEPLPWVEWHYAEWCARPPAVLRALPEPRALRRLVPLYAERLISGEPITGAEAWELHDTMLASALRDVEAASLEAALFVAFPPAVDCGARYRAYVDELHQAYLAVTADCGVTRRGG